MIFSKAHEIKVVEIISKFLWLNQSVRFIKVLKILSKFYGFLSNFYEIPLETFNQLTIEPIKHKYCNFTFILQSISFMFFYWIYFDNISDNDNYEYDWTVEASCSALYLSSSGNCCDIVTPPPIQSGMSNSLRNPWDLWLIQKKLGKLFLFNCGFSFVSDLHIQGTVVLLKWRVTWNYKECLHL